MSRLALLFATLLFSATAASVAGGEGGVRFDVAHLATARVTKDTEKGSASTPDQMVVEIPINVSAFAAESLAAHLVRLEVEIRSLSPSMMVEDYLPKTKLSSDIVGSVKVEKAQEKSKHLGVNVTGSYERLLKATGIADAGSKDRETIRYEQLPKLESVAASGVIARGMGVYYKLRSSTQTSLEGGKTFVIRFQVPRDWDRGLLQVTTRAITTQRNLLSSRSEKQSGAARFLVATHLETSSEARTAARAFVDQELKMFRLAHALRRQIARARYSSLAHKFGAAIDVSTPRIPKAWLSEVMDQHSAQPVRELLERLPTELQSAANEYYAAKAGLVR